MSRDNYENLQKIIESSIVNKHQKPLEQSEERKQGFRAFENGLSENDNPYAIDEYTTDEEKAMEWDEGYSYALNLRRQEETMEEGCGQNACESINEEFRDGAQAFLSLPSEQQKKIINMYWDENLEDPDTDFLAEIALALKIKVRDSEEFEYSADQFRTQSLKYPKLFANVIFSDLEGFAYWLEGNGMESGWVYESCELGESKITEGKSS